jgi:hypothetical protein
MLLWYELHWRYWSISLWHDVKRAHQAIEHRMGRD